MQTGARASRTFGTAHGAVISASHVLTPKGVKTRTPSRWVGYSVDGEVERPFEATEVTHCHVTFVPFVQFLEIRSPWASSFQLKSNMSMHEGMVIVTI